MENSSSLTTALSKFQQWESYSPKYTEIVQSHDCSTRLPWKTSSEKMGRPGGLPGCSGIMKSLQFLTKDTTNAGQGASVLWLKRKATCDRHVRYLVMNGFNPKNVELKRKMGKRLQVEEKPQECSEIWGVKGRHLVENSVPVHGDAWIVTKFIIQKW